jgi:23S rRNA maturation-related 3'-5' exoribonuclease YhaM
MSLATETFGRELGLIADDTLRNFTEYVLTKAPTYFWVVPSSSTGKYHSRQSNGDGGLVRHTKAVVYFSEILCRAYSVEGKDKDIVVASCVLHDVVKYGLVMEKYTTKTHDKEGANFILALGRPFEGLDSEDLGRIVQNVGLHMGQWTKHERAKKFPEEYRVDELIVHLADMCSAGKEVNLEFLQENLIG